MQTTYRLSILIIFLAGSFAFAKAPAKKIKVLSATSQVFAGGAAGSKSNVTYRILLFALASSNTLVIDKLWIRDEYYEVTAYHHLSGSTTFKKNDSLLVFAKKYLPYNSSMDIKNQEQVVISAAPPFEYNEDALLGYKCGKKRNYIRIPKIEVLPRENRP
jgi:hypothetical protein